MFRKTVIAAALATIAALGAVPVQAHYHDRGWNDHHGYYHDHGYHDRRCRNNGTGGAIIGGVAGGLLGNAVAGHGDKTLGTVLGAGGGALAGNAIARNGSHRC
jgi:hypothetical protein